jgi:hypothetical protein
MARVERAPKLQPGPLSGRIWAETFLKDFQKKMLDKGKFVKNMSIEQKTPIPWRVNGRSTMQHCVERK